MAKSKNFICTGNGFVKEFNHYFDEDTSQMVTDITYTDQLMYAGVFSTKEAQNIIEKFNIHGFIYKPFKETHIKTFIVKERVDSHHYFNKSRYNGFSVKKETFSVNDVSFLNNHLDIFTGDKFQNIDDAEKYANKLNNEIIKNIEKTINDNKNMLE